MRGIFSTARIAFRMLFDRPARAVLSSLGVTFSVVIMFMELGFFNGSNDSSANLPQLFDCDLVMTHVRKNHLKTGEEFSELRLNTVRSIEGVARAVPLYGGANYWWNPANSTRHRAYILGVDVEDPMLKLPHLTTTIDALREPGAVFFDRLSRRELGRPSVGTHSVLGYANVKVAGLFELGPNFTYEGHLITGSETFLQAARESANRLDFGLIRLAPGADLETVRARLLAALPPDELQLHTPQELYEREVMITTQRSPTGVVFGIGLLVGFFIGIIVCYQILFNEVSDHLPQFATIKAMGLPPRFITGIVMWEALFLAGAGFLPGLALSHLLYLNIEHFTQIRMFLTPGRAGLILALAGGMCLVAGQLALRRVHAADPADLY